MKVYLIDNRDTAVQLSQLLKLNAECVKLHWSTSIKDIPSDVNNSLEIIELFIEKKVYQNCSEKNILGELTENEEMELISIIKSNPSLSNTLGIGVILSGEQSKNVYNILLDTNAPKLIFDALSSEKNIIIF